MSQSEAKRLAAWCNTHDLGVDGDCASVAGDAVVIRSCAIDVVTGAADVVVQTVHSFAEARAVLDY